MVISQPTDRSRTGPATAAAPSHGAAPSALLGADEASRIALDLTERHGRGALDLARTRAARTIEIGDDLAYGAWQAIISEIRGILGPRPARPLAAASAYRRPLPAGRPAILSISGLT